ncbi:MAG: DNA/RNA nuclease SfsA [Caenispirillum bisanense]|nr:DNA/RNA nuclease SfsA [Caenispirillum bisanense]MCA1973967.1 DNA/RNA nuclease SfsA [Caenispirillum sp.]
MLFKTPLVRGTLIKRYKRFLADVTLDDGTVVTAHTANSGSMMGCCEPGSEVWLSPADNPERKLKWTWELIRVGDGLVGINTSWPNALVAEACAEGLIPEVAGYDTVRREVKYGKNSRIDVLLEKADGSRCYVEVKNVTLARDGHAEFPDAVTARGAKHLVEMTDMVAEGHRAVMVYLVQREDCEAFRVAADIDPAYRDALALAMSKGVEAVCWACRVTPEGITVARPLPLRLDAPLAVA